jgi:hypothetical protein
MKNNNAISPKYQSPRIKRNIMECTSDVEFKNYKSMPSIGKINYPNHPKKFLTIFTEGLEVNDYNTNYNQFSSILFTTPKLDGHNNNKYICRGESQLKLKEIFNNSNYSTILKLNKTLARCNYEKTNILTDRSTCSKTTLKKAEEYLECLMENGINNNYQNSCKNYLITDQSDTNLNENSSTAYSKLKIIENLESFSLIRQEQVKSVKEKKKRNKDSVYSSFCYGIIFKLLIIFLFVSILAYRVRYQFLSSISQKLVKYEIVIHKNIKELFN